MPVALIPAVALTVGAACGIYVQSPVAVWLAAVTAGVVAALGGKRLGWPIVTRVAVIAAALAAGAALADRAREQALHPSLRAVLDRGLGGFVIDRVNVGGDHDPIPTRAVVAEDAAHGEQFTSLRTRVTSVYVRGKWEPVDGGVTLSIGGQVSTERASQWLAGRTLELPVTYRRPSRYLNDGVPDLERALALDGTTLFGSVKSGLLVQVVQRAGRMGECAARIRLRTRALVSRRVGRHSALSAAIVTAVLIGDRTGLPGDVRLRLQAAGTYHVIAISGGNIAILAALVVGALMLLGVSGRVAAAGALLILLAYTGIVSGGASVWRATLMASIYLAARLLDQRTPPWHAMAIAAIVVIATHPLDVRDAGFLLTFGATAALLEVARRATCRQDVAPAIRWLAGAVAASLAAEAALLPIAASTFSRVTAAGLVLNLVAIPAMTLTQAAGIIVATAGNVAPLGELAGWLAHAGASLLVSSARLVDVAPWLTARMPPPSLLLVAVYYAGLVGVLWSRGAARVCGAVTWAIAAVLIVLGLDPMAFRERIPPGSMRLTAFDVGQGDGMLLELPDRSIAMVDSGGAPFGSGTFDLGGRVLAPALWARGVRALTALLVTHPDPDHIGGAAALVGDFAPRELWEGIPVAGNAPLAALHTLGDGEPIRARQLRLGSAWDAGGARVRVLHPPPPDWERRKVRNDDSVVLEITYGDVALLLTGDIGAGIERAIVPQLTPARVRILKVAHHGSRTSSSRELLDAWRPQIAVISCGRGNRFGHPAPDVIARLESIGARIYRTDRDGQITLTTDGNEVHVETFTGGKR